MGFSRTCSFSMQLKFALYGQHFVKQPIVVFRLSSRGALKTNSIVKISFVNRPGSTFLNIFARV